MEETIRAEIEKNTPSSIQREGFAHRFYYYHAVSPEFLSEGRTVSKEYNLYLVRCLCKTNVRICVG